MLAGVRAGAPTAMLSAGTPAPRSSSSARGNRSRSASAASAAAAAAAAAVVAAAVVTPGRSSPSASPDVTASTNRRGSVTGRKLYNFFGDLPPLDVSLAEIQGEGLRAMLHAKLPLCYFLHALLDEYAAENLFFVLEVDRYEATPFADPVQHLQAAFSLFETYLGHGSQLEVNVDDRVRKGVVKDLARLSRACAHATKAESAASATPSEAGTGPSLAVGLRHLFLPAKTAVLALLDASYTKFARSPLAARMAAELETATTDAADGGGTVYTPRARHFALNVLVEYMDRHGLLAPPPPSAASMPNAAVDISAPTSAVDGGDGSEVGSSVAAGAAAAMSLLTHGDPATRHALMRRMLQGFGITLLGVDLVAYANAVLREP
ncbi:hypothetical protein AMAG_15367 [Allomyces macrogynus ATCC 38327]|uniref:RGS domain-containing protein n=1 Tax=Allomyces macrogynus (strain ATCC 38327) TaxID=578462 RepID=A0A0L0T787_ALLM3|nr:hypothetical protein AMAG_15367 [Allomyces macrogynus ATCC 38327]|eukprot:KNE70607.1 hypothetical protein AMAG_15367 [Allomyces macrogynus ATCC 38327]